MDRLDILKLSVGPGLKQVDHKKKNLEPVKEETLEKMEKLSAHGFTLQERVLSIPVTLNDIEANGVVDTGADATVISSDFASVAGIDTKGCKKACLLNAEDGAEMTAFGDVTATLKIGSHTTSWHVYVAPIRDSVLIGMDRLDSLDAVIYTRQGNLRIGKEIISGTLSCDGSGRTCSAFLVHENCWVPPESERIIIGRVQIPRTRTPGVLDSCDDELLSGILVGSFLVNMESKVPVRVLNVRDQRVCFVKGMH